MRKFIKIKKTYILFLSLVVFSLILISSSYSQNNSGGAHIEMSGNRITATFKDIPLITVLKSIQKITGIDYTLPKSEWDKKINAAFESVPIEKAIKRIFLHLNYSIIFGKSNKILAVYIPEKKYHLTIPIDKQLVNTATTTNYPITQMDVNAGPVTQMDVNAGPVTQMDVNAGPVTQMDINAGPVTQMDVF